MTAKGRDSNIPATCLPSPGRHLPSIHLLARPYVRLISNADRRCCFQPRQRPEKDHRLQYIGYGVVPGGHVGREANGIEDMHGNRGTWPRWVGSGWGGLTGLRRTARGCVSFSRFRCAATCSDNSERSKYGSGGAGVLVSMLISGV